MSRFLGSITKKARRYGISLLENEREFIKGKKRHYAPGEHGKKFNRTNSDYSLQLREKQKLKFIYGLNDKQFRRFFVIAKRMKAALTLNILVVLESRLDNLVFRMGFAPTRRAARQLVNHGHILVDNKKVTIPSFLVKLNQTVSVKEKSKNLPVVLEGKTNSSCKYVLVDNATKQGTYIRFPQRDELSDEIKETHVVE